MKRRITNVLLACILAINVSNFLITLIDTADNNQNLYVQEQKVDGNIETETIDDSYCMGVENITNTNFLEMENDLNIFVETGRVNSYRKYGDSFEVIDVDYFTYYANETPVWEAIVVFKYKDGDVTYGED